MTTDNTKEYPFEIKNVTSQDAVQLNEIFTNSDFYRFGPKGYIGHEGIKDSAFRIYSMKFRPTDIIVVAHPRSGTTWTQELIWMLANDLDYEKSKSIKMIQRFPFIESSSLLTPHIRKILLEKNQNNQQNLQLLEDLIKPAQNLLDQATSPRFMKTHFPLSLLPPGMLDTAKVVYVARDPRDVAVSQYHLYKLAKICDDCDFKTFWNAFMKDLINYTPYFEHLKEAWEIRHHPNMLFLFYEDLSKDLSGMIQNTAKFLNKKITERDLSRLCEHLSFENFKKNDSFIPDVYEEIGLLTDSNHFIRRGKAGGWRDYFDSDMAERAEQWLSNNLRDTDFRFPVTD